MRKIKLDGRPELRALVESVAKQSGMAPPYEVVIDDNLTGRNIEARGPNGVDRYSYEKGLLTRVAPERD